MKKEKVVIGWREKISIPSLDVKEIKVKVDTGARTSSIHVSELEVIKKGKYYYADFVIHPVQRKSHPSIKKRVRIISFRDVRSSNGISSERPVIMATVELGSVKKEVEMTLVNRDMMGFRMLLGRTAIRPDFLVDVSKSFLLEKKKKKRRLS